MKTRLLILLCSIAVVLGFGLAGCASNDAGLEDGTYVVDFTTDHPMFHVNDANNDKGILTVQDGEMTVHVSLQSKKIVNLFAGTSEDARKEGAALIEPTVDHIDYGDGYEADVYGFDIPVPALDEAFDVALIGTHGNWYDHKAVVSNPVPGDDIHAGTAVDLEDGDYKVETELEGGTGKATVSSPADMTVRSGQATVTLEWSSPYYDYMIVNDTKYEPVNEDGNSVFEIPVPKLAEPFKVIGNTTAMSEPHEIEYDLTLTLAEQP